MKKKRKFIVPDRIDVSGMEQWLEKMALEGLFPARFGAFFCTFRTSEPKRVRYRLEPISKRTQPKDTQTFDPNRPVQNSPADDELMELYESAGWKYVCKDSAYFYVFSTEDPCAPEPYNDTLSRCESLLALQKRLRGTVAWGTTVIGLLLLSAIAAITESQSLFPVDMSYRYVLMLIKFPIILALWLPVSFIKDIHNWRLIRKIRASLNDGVIPPPAKNNVFTRKLHYILTILVTILLVINLFSGAFTQLLTIERVPGFTSILEEMEDGRANSRTYDGPGRIYYGEDMSKKNRISFSTSIWSPVQYEAEEVLYDAQQRETGEWATYFTTLDTAYYHCLFPSMAESVALAQLDVYKTVNEDWKYNYVDCPGADYAILGYVDDDHCRLAAVVNGSKVAVYKHWYGESDLDEHLDLLTFAVQ